MPYYVLLVIDDEEHAKDFTACVLSDEAVLVPSPDSDGCAAYAARVWGVWAKPESFCSCKRTGGRTASGFRRDPDTGWWVCGQCNKPTKGWASGNQWFSVLGATLLPKEFQPYPDDDPSPPSRKEWRDLIDE